MTGNEMNDTIGTNVYSKARELLNSRLAHDVIGKSRHFHK